MRCLTLLLAWCSIGLPFAGPSSAEEASEYGIANWVAPPYWVPPSAEKHSRSALAAATPLPFFAIAPCRVADTRPGSGFTGAFGPPFMPGGGPRSFTVWGQCGIPATAQAVSFNFTVTNTAGTGFLLVFPEGGMQPTASTLNYVMAQTIANAAIVPLGATGGLTAIPGVSGFDLIIDVNGYYAPDGVVNTVNGLSRAVTLAPGSNVTITPSGNTLTIASTGGGGGGPSGLTPGGITFGSSSGTLAQDPSDLFWNVSTHRLGLGTATPNQQLELTGMMRMPETSATAGSPTAGVLFLGSTPFLHNYAPTPSRPNTFLGLSAGNFAMTSPFPGGGSENIGIGASSLTNLTTGYLNTAVGFNTLTANSTGTDNTAVGAYALPWIVDGRFNTAVGVNTLASNVSSLSNIAVGHSALPLLTVGGFNTAVGVGAFESLYNGKFNTAVGISAMASLGSGNRNIALGSGSGQLISQGDDNIYIGSSAGGNENGTIRIGDAAAQKRAFLAGVRGVTPAQPNAVPVVIDSSGQLGTAAGSGGLLPSGSFGQTLRHDGSSWVANSGVTSDGVSAAVAGVLSLPLNVEIRANGLKFLTNNDSKLSLTLGLNSGANLAIGGSFNTAFGTSTLFSTTSGQGNTAVGHFAGYSNDIGNSNTAIGRLSMYSNVGGSQNTAIGQQSLNLNVSGSENVAVGYLALRKATDCSNTAVGSQALSSMADGSGNVGLGQGSGQVLIAGSNNLLLGTGAGASLQSGGDNVLIGADSGNSNESATIRIGAAQTAAYIAGISGRTSASGVGVFVNAGGKLGTTTSSRRYKDDIVDMGDQSAALMRLRPVAFLYKPEYDPDRLPQYGLVAEEVAEVAPSLVVYGKDGSPETVRYHLVNAMLLNEVQSQHRTLQEQHAELAAREAQIANLERRLAALEERVRGR